MHARRGEEIEDHAGGGFRPLRSNAARPQFFKQLRVRQPGEFHAVEPAAQLLAQQAAHRNREGVQIDRSGRPVQFVGLQKVHHQVLPAEGSQDFAQFRCVEHAAAPTQALDRHVREMRQFRVAIVEAADGNRLHRERHGHGFLRGARLVHRGPRQRHRVFQVPDRQDAVFLGDRAVAVFGAVPAVGVKHALGLLRRGQRLLRPRRDPAARLQSERRRAVRRPGRAPVAPRSADLRIRPACGARPSALGRSPRPAGCAGPHTASAHFFSNSQTCSNPISLLKSWKS